MEPDNEEVQLELREETRHPFLEDEPSTEINGVEMVAKEQRTECQNPACDTTFTFRRPHHCRRCGEIFCRSCLQYTRRMNDKSEFDEHAELRKVCLRCFLERLDDPEVVIRSRSEELSSERKVVQREKIESVCEVSMEIRSLSIQPAFWKDQFQVDMTKECRRLLQGFKTGIGSSGTSRTWCEIRADYIKVPSWQKSTFWRIEKARKNCRHCSSKIKNVLHNCRVCGISLCKKCSYKSLLVYIDDSERILIASSNPKVAVIKVVGCPEKEPIISLLLPVCKDCREEITRRQTKDRAWYLERPRPVDIITMLVEMEEKFKQLHSEIDIRLKRLEKLRQRPNRRASRIVRVLTDEFGDRVRDTAPILTEITEYQATMMSLFSKLESIQKHNALQGAKLSILKNCIRARKDYYWSTKRQVALLASTNDDNGDSRPKTRNNEV